MTRSRCVFPIDTFWFVSFIFYLLRSVLIRKYWFDANHMIRIIKYHFYINYDAYHVIRITEKKVSFRIFAKKKRIIKWIMTLKTNQKCIIFLASKMYQKRIWCASKSIWCASTNFFLLRISWARKSIKNGSYLGKTVQKSIKTLKTVQKRIIFIGSIMYQKRIWCVSKSITMRLFRKVSLRIFLGKNGSPNESFCQPKRIKKIWLVFLIRF